MKVPQYKPSRAGVAGGGGGGEATYPSWGGGQETPSRSVLAGLQKRCCLQVSFFTFPSLWPSSFTCPSPSLPGTAHSAKKFGERDGAASPRWEWEQPPQPQLPGAWLPWGALENIAAFGYPLMGGEVCQGCTEHCLPVQKGIAGAVPGLLLFFPWLQRAPRHPAPVSKEKCARADGT